MARREVACRDGRRTARAAAGIPAAERRRFGTWMSQNVYRARRRNRGVQSTPFVKPTKFVVCEIHAFTHGGVRMIYTLNFHAILRSVPLIRRMISVRLENLKIEIDAVYTKSI